MKNKLQGFTLIHIVAGLVLLAIFIFAFNTGRHLVKQSALVSAVNNINMIDSAVGTFKGKYSFLPGDMPNAHNFNLNISPKNVKNLAYTSSSTDFDGNGDGFLEAALFYPDYKKPVPIKGEMLNFWIHLYNSTFIAKEFNANPSGCGDDRDATKNNCSPIYYQSLAGNGIVALTGNIGLTSPLRYIIGINADYKSTTLDINGKEGGADSLIGDTLTPEQAQFIDGKLDDGAPDRGKVRVISSYHYDPTGRYSTFNEDKTLSANDCYSGPSKPYNIALDMDVCTLAVESKNN